VITASSPPTRSGALRRLDHHILDEDFEGRNRCHGAVSRHQVVRWSITWLCMVGLLVAAAPIAKAAPDRLVMAGDGDFENASDSQPAQAQPKELRGLNHPDGRLEVTRAAVLEKFIRVAYERLSRLVGRSGEKIEFELSDFRTYYPEEYDQANWLSVVDMPAGWVVDVSRKRERRVEGGAVTSSRIWYEASWDHRSEFPVTDELRSATLQDMVDSAQTDDFFGGRSHLALTSYEVVVSFQGRQRTYRAAFHWFGSETDETPVTVSDLITQGVDLALAEPTTPPLGEEVTQGDRERDHAPSKPGLSESIRWRDDHRPGLGDHPGWSSVSGAVNSSSCVAESKSDSVKLNNVGQDDHTQGHHIASASFEISCTCESDCETSCQSNVKQEQCLDEGACLNCYNDPLTTCHTASPPSTDQELVTALESATCGGVVGCAFTKCKLGCLCGASVSVDVSQGAASIKSFSGSWSQKQTRTKTCYCKQSDPCSSSGTLVGGAVVANIFLPCDDGGGGGSGDPAEGGDEPEPGSGTPILIDLGGRGYQLSSTVDGVRFDLDADGDPELMSWTERASDDAFLALDRSGNGLIDDGTELFGDATDQPPGGIRHGYRALAEFDKVENGGNQDGRITAADSVFDNLLLWIDTDHDGRSDAGELSRVSSWSIHSLDLEYVEARRKDRHGNEIRYFSKALLEVQRGQGRPHLSMADVIFLRQ